jgi:polar amino acid transport system substrate-binding protein
VGDAVAPGYYVVYARQGDKALIGAINDAIVDMYRSGDLERIYAPYGMWNADQAQIGEIIEAGQFYGLKKALEAPSEGLPEGAPAEGAPAADGAAGGTAGAAVTVATPGPGDAPHAAEPAEGKVASFAKILGKSAGMTIFLSITSFPLAILIGLSVAVGRLYGPTWLKLPLTAYVEFLRGTPLMLQLYFIFYFLPEMGITIPAIPTAILGLAINYSAYESEIYRAGLQAIPHGQMEAALSLGMSRPQALRRIIVPQAFRIVIPPVVNDFIAMFKDTSVCSVVTIIELTKQFSVLSRNNVSDLIVLMALTGLFYLLMSYPMSLLARNIEKRLGNEVRV